MARGRGRHGGVEAAGLFLSWIGKLPGLPCAWPWRSSTYGGPGISPDASAPSSISKAATLAAVGFLEGYALPMAKRAFGDAAWPQAERDAAGLAKWLLAQDPLPLVVNARALRRRPVLHTREVDRRYEAGPGGA